MANLSLSRWTTDDVKEMCQCIAGHAKTNTNIATHLERELFADVLRYIEKYSCDKNSQLMAQEALLTLQIPFKRIMG